MVSRMMQENRLRWVLIKFLSKDSLGEIHTAEKAAGKYWNEVWSGPFRARIMNEHKLIPFWIGTVPDSTQKQRVDDWLSSIFPIWGKIISAWEATWDNPKPEGHEGVYWIESDMSVQHRIEQEIWRNAERINRLSDSNATKDMERNRMADQYQSANE